MNAPLRGISSMATRKVLAELAAQWQAGGGCPVEIESVGGVDAARRVQAGEPFDLVFLASDAIDRLVEAGHLAPASKRDLMRSSTAVAVRAGAPRPAIDSESALREAVLAAPSIGYSTGPSGVALQALFARWGLAEALAPRLVQARPGVPVGALVASGEAALGFQQLSELLGLPGIDILGELPAAVAIDTVFSAAVLADRTRPEATALLNYFASDAADAARQRHGMRRP